MHCLYLFTDIQETDDSNGVVYHIYYNAVLNDIPPPYCQWHDFTLDLKKTK